MWNRRACTVFSTLILISATTAVSRAAIAYDTLGPNNSFQAQSWLLGSPELDQDIAQAVQAWRTGSMESLTLAITHYAFQNSYDVQLFTDNNGRPGTLLHAWTNVAAPADSILVLEPEELVTLQAGYNYWVAVSVPLGGANTVGGWNYDALPGNNQRFLFSQHGGAWSPQEGERCGLRIEIADAPSNCAADLDQDNDVDLTDLTIFLSQFGLICP